MHIYVKFGHSETPLCNEQGRIQLLSKVGRGGGGGGGYIRHNITVGESTQRHSSRKKLIFGKNIVHFL